MILIDKLTNIPQKLMFKWRIRADPIVIYHLDKNQN